MSTFSVAVLAVGGVSTLALLLYVKLLLPSKLEQRSLESMRAFSKAIELRFPSHSGLTEEVLRLACLVADSLSLPRADRHELEMAIYLRDVGLCAIPYKLVNGISPLKWTDAQQATYDRHAEVGGAMLESVPSLTHLADAVRYHHMRHDDYPKLVNGDEFSPPLLSEIINACAAYVWLAGHYGAAAARAKVEGGAGTDFDPAVATALLGVITSSRAEEPLRPAVV